MEKLQALAAYLPMLESPDFNAGHIQDSVQTEPGVFTMPYADYSEEASEFVQAAYEHGWVLRNFSWGDWKQTEEAIKLRDDESALARATPQQLYQLLTVVIRQDRFCEGALLDAFESGLILRIVRRAADIVKAEEEL